MLPSTDPLAGRQKMATNSLKDPHDDNAGTARGELAALHEMVGSLAAMLYQLSTSLNGLSGSNQLIYTAYTLRLWILRWWALIQHEAERQINAMQPGQRSQLAIHQHGCACMYCQEMEASAASLLLGKVVPYLISPEYTPDMGVAKLHFGAERSKEESKSARLLFEPRHAAWQSSDPFTFTKESERHFDKNLQISSACLRKELDHLASDIATMESVNERPSFQSFRLALKAVYDAFPVAQRGCDHKGCLSWVQSEKFCQGSERHSHLISFRPQGRKRQDCRTLKQL